MKQIIPVVAFIILSVLSACDRSPAPEKTQPDAVVTDTAPADSHAAPATGAMKATASLEPGQYAVDLADDAIVIRANQVNELVLFRGIANKAKFQLFTENFDWKTVSVDIHAKTLQAAVVELLSAYPYEIIYSPDESGQQQALSEVVIGKPTAAVAEQKDEDKKAAPEPGVEALLYIKEFDPLGQQQAYLEKLQDPTPEIRAAAAREIKPTSENLPTMTNLLTNDPSPEVRIAATWSLEVSEDAETPQAIAALVKCLDDKDYSVVEECVDSLAFIGDETTIVYLQPLMTHPDEDVRSAALEAIRWLQ